MNDRQQALLEEAGKFITLYCRENPAAESAESRIQNLRRQIEQTGTYEHTASELAYGARVAWRNAARCIGRLYWRTLQVRDRRSVTTAAGIAAETEAHLRIATNGGRIRPVITVFAPTGPDGTGPRIWNEQLVRYAGWYEPDGTPTGDPRSVGMTWLAERLGWRGQHGKFEILPLIISAPGGPPELRHLLPDAVLEVLLSHPSLPWFAGLGLRWHAVPVISDMCLEIGGICYPAAPFNGWYQATEIGARNLGDPGRYNLLAEVARRMSLDTTTERSMWRDRALVELVQAVVHSFDEAGVTIADHHSESAHFLAHLAAEHRAGRSCPADWSWIVPPLSGSATGVFHRSYDTSELLPRYVRHDHPHSAPPSGVQAVPGVPSLNGRARPGDARNIARELAATGSRLSRRALRQAGLRGANSELDRLVRLVRAELNGAAVQAAPPGSAPRACSQARAG